METEASVSTKTEDNHLIHMVIQAQQIKTQKQFNPTAATVVAFENSASLSHRCYKCTTNQSQFHGVSGHERA